MNFKRNSCKLTQKAPVKFKLLQISIATCFFLTASTPLFAGSPPSFYTSYFHALDSLIKTGKSEIAVNNLYRSEDNLAKLFVLSGGLISYEKYIRPFYDLAVTFMVQKFDAIGKIDLASMTYRFVERNKILQDASQSFKVPIQYNRLIHHQQIESINNMHAKFTEFGIEERITAMLDNQYPDDDKTEKLEAAILELRVNEPLYYQFAYNISVPTLAEIQNNLLKVGKSYLIFHEYSNYAAAIALNSDTILIRNLTLDDNVKESIALISRRISIPPSGNEVDMDLLNACSHLYDAIILSVWDEKSLPLELVISTDKLTSQIPYDALIQKKYNPKESINDIAWLIKYATISYTPFIRYDLNLSRIETSVRGRKPILGIFDDQPGTSFISSSDNQMLQGFKRINQELGFSGNILSGKRATRESFSERYNQYKIIHYDKSCENIGSSGPVCLHFESTRDVNQLLCTDEWYSLNLNADLFVLSSCQLSGADLINQSQFGKISHAIRHQQGPVLISSLWPLGPEQNWLIFEQFYKYLIAGETIHNSWQKARLNILNRSINTTWSDIHPYFWAGFINIGFDNNIDLEKSKKYPIWVMLYLICIFFVFILYRVFKKQHSNALIDENYNLDYSTHGLSKVLQNEKLD